MSLATGNTRTHRAERKGSRRARWLALLTAAALVWPALQPPASADPTSPISVTNVASPSPVASGAEITYTITMTNTGGSKLTNLVLTDQLNGVGTLQSPPAIPQYAITSTQGTCTQSGQLVSCNGGTLNGGASWTVTIRGLVTAPSGSTLNNTANVTGTRSAQNFTTNASNQTLVQGGSGSPLPDLTINKTGPSSVAENASFDYLLTVNNLGTELANDIKVTDTLPAGVTLQATPFTTTSLFTCAPSGADPITVTCTGGRVNAGQNGSIRLHVVAPATGSLTNTAAVDPDNTIAEGNELNNTSAVVNTAVTAAPQQGAITITKSDAPDPVFPGQELVYKVVVTNASTTRADDVVVVDGTQGLVASSVVATQVIVNGALGNGNGCVVNAPEVRCKIRSLNSGGTLTITIRGEVMAPAGTVLINTATATANIRNTGVRATATARTTVKPQFDLTITKAGQPDPVCARSWPSSNAADLCTGGLKYTFVVGNSGVDATPKVVVRDVLPAGVIYDSTVPGSDFSCDLDVPTNALTCTATSIAAESTATFSIIVIPPSSTGPLTNNVVVDPNNSIFEADETNNNASATVQVSTGIDLTIFKYDEKGVATADPAGRIPAYPSPLDGFDPIATNGTQTYTIYVDNLGTQDSTDVRVEDTLPAGTRFLSVEGDQGFTCSHDGSATGGKVTCVGGHLDGTFKEFYKKTPDENQFATITIRLFATGFVQPKMHNEVRVDPLDTIAEFNEGNNFAFQDTVVGTGGAGESAFNQLKISKAQTSPAAGDPVATNGILKYVLTIDNDGTDPVSNVVVKDFLPTGSRFISAKDAEVGDGATDRFFCTHDGSATGGTISCTGGDFSGTVNTIPDPGEVPADTVDTQRTIEVVVYAPDVPGTYTNLAKVDPDDVVPEGNEFDNSAEAQTVVKTASDGGENSFVQLEIEKTATPEVATSSVITYTLDVSNTGTNPAFNVSVRDVLPAGTQFISAEETTGAGASTKFNCSESGGTVTCTGATISGTDVSASGAPELRTIEIKAFSPNRPMTVTNTAFVDPNNLIPEGDETDNQSSDSTKVVVGAGFIDLRIAKCDTAIVLDCASDVEKYDSGDEIKYVIDVSNAGTDPAFQVVVRDALPAGMTFLSAEDVTAVEDGSFLCGESGGVVTCTGGTIDGTAGLIPGMPSVRTIEIVVRAPEVAFRTYTNQVSVDPFNAIAESNETNNTARDTLEVSSPYDLTITKDGPSTAQQGNTESYVLTVSNLGRAVEDVVVRDPLPVGLIPLGVEAEGNFSCQILENPVNVVECVGDLGAKDTDTDKAKITINVFITQDGGTLDNEACVDPDDTIVESDEDNNCKTKITPIEPPRSPNISVQKSASSGTVSIGDTLDYSISVSNTGDVKSFEFDVTDDLPDDVSIVGTPTATNGLAVCAHDGAATGGTVTCTVTDGLNPGQSFTISIQTKVEDTASGALVNTVIVEDGLGVAPDFDIEPCASNPTTACEVEKDENLANNTDSVTTNVSGTAIDLAVGDITDPLDPIEPGDTAIFTIPVTNAGSQDAKAADGNQVVVRVSLPTVGVTHISTTASQGFSCVLSSGSSVATCTGDLLAGQSTVITSRLTATGSGPLTVTATADPDDAIIETDETNNEQTEITTVTNLACTACVDLSVGQIFAAPNPVKAGSPVEYAFAVANIGDQSTESDPDPDTVVVEVDLVDASFGSISATAGFTCGANPAFIGDPTEPELLCTGPATGLDPAQGTLITVTATPTGGAGTTTGISVFADPGNVIAEDTALNNFGSITVGVVAP